jgi:hypothetical protein
LIVRRLGLFLGLALIVAQVIPVDRSNPAVESDVPAPLAVRDILRRACYDCHSNETVWPWYSRVAPASWLVARDVHQARQQLNFSTWNRLTAPERAHTLEEILEEVQAGDMPLAIYLPLHPEAQLTDANIEAIAAWVQSAAAR